MRCPILFETIPFCFQQPQVGVSASSDLVNTMEGLFEYAESHFWPDIPECDIWLRSTLSRTLTHRPFYFIPVCLQVYQQGGRPLLSNDRTAPLDPFDTVHLCPGHLIRAFPAGLNPRRQHTSSTRLQHMFDEFGDLALDGPPSPDYSGFVIGVLAPAEQPCVFAAIERHAQEMQLRFSEPCIARLLLFSCLRLRICWMRVAINGVPISRLFAVLPVFVDPRAVAQDVRAVLLPPVPLAPCRLRGAIAWHWC